MAAETETNGEREPVTGPPRRRMVKGLAAILAVLSAALGMAIGALPTSAGPPAGLVGWASANGGTTGGSTTNVVRVSTVADFKAAVTSSTSQTVILTAGITLKEMIRVASNKTIVGDGAGPTILGGGLNISGQRNVIVRNLRFDKWADDAINIEKSSTNVWIDHNTFGVGFDGAVDIKRGSDYITVSWNKVSGHNKVMVLGHSDGNGAQDSGHLRVTYHHNWFEGTTQRMPRVRFGNPVHVFNNYYQGVSGYGVASTEGAGVLVEGNYFENTKDPFHRGEGASDQGALVARNNHFVNSGQGQTGGSVAAIPYAYALDKASSVKSIVTGDAGAGHLPATTGGGGTSSTVKPATTTTAKATTTTKAKATTTTAKATTTTKARPATGAGPEGWATANGGTTGGAGGPVVEVANAADFVAAISRSGPATVRLTADIRLSGMSRVSSDKTVVGAGSGAIITGGGLTVSGQRNVIIRNLSFAGWDDDAVNVEKSSTNIWIDHNSFGVGYDGAVDIKRGSDYITVSWNTFTDHGKTMLLGHDDGNGRQDIGHLRVSYHHNYFNGSHTRHPRVRFGNPVHVYNNYYRGNEYGVASTMDAGVLVEGNYFENVKEPTLVGYADSDPGSLVQRNNIFAGSGQPRAAGSVASIPYAYKLDDPNQVPALVTNGAGAGRITG